MEIWWSMGAFAEENTPLLAVCGAAVFLLVLGAYLTVKTGSAGLYLAISAVAGGGFALVGLIFIKDFYLCAYAAAGLLIFDGLAYVTAFCVMLAKQKAWERRARRAEQGRRLEYGLPDRENTFVQARLNTVLRTDYGEDGLPVLEQVDLGYAKKMLADLLAKPLSAAERLQAEDIGKTFGLYLHKPQWRACDLRVVNDAFSALMKLCTKYSVTV